MKKLFTILMLMVSVFAFSQEVQVITDNFSDGAEIHISYWDTTKSAALLFYIDETKGVLDENPMGLVLITTEYLGSDSSLVLYKFGNDVKHSSMWIIGHDGTTVKRHITKSLLLDLSSHKTLYMRVYDYNKNYYDFEFDIEGFKKVYQDTMEKYIKH